MNSSVTSRTLDISTLPFVTTAGTNSSTNSSGIPYWSLPWRVGLSLSMFVFMVVAVIGNIMVILVIARHRGMRTRTNMFLCNLAVADLLTALLLMPVALVTVGSGRWVFGSVFCQVNGFAMPLFFVASIHTLMYISVHKYITITRPFSRSMGRRRILLVIGAAWVWALLTGYVTVHGLNTVLYKPSTTQCGPAYPSDLRTYMHPVYISLTCYLLPFVVMAFCYTRVFRELREHGARMRANSNLEKEMLYQQQRRITVTLFMVLAVFVISWTPYILYSFYVSAVRDKDSFPAFANPLSYWFGYMNSACNPIIYALRSKAFRDGYRELCCRADYGAISEATEPTDQHSALHRLQTFIQNSLRPRGPALSLSASRTHSGPQPRKDSAGSIASLLIHHRTRVPSTGSLPETLHYNVASLPRLSAGRRSSQALGSARLSQPSLPKKLSDSSMNGRVVVEKETRVHAEQSSPDGSAVSEAREPAVAEDSVLVSIDDVDVSSAGEPSATTPLVPVKGVGGDKDWHSAADLLPRRLTLRSVSATEPQMEYDADGPVREEHQLLHSSYQSSPGELHTGETREKDSRRNEVTSTPSAKKRKNKRLLGVPGWRSILRSLSEDTGRKDSSGARSGGGDGMNKSLSESQGINQHRDREIKKASEDRLPGSQNTPLDNNSRRSEGTTELRRACSERPRLLQLPSIERLDLHSRRLSRSLTFTWKNRRRRWGQEQTADQGEDTVEAVGGQVGRQKPRTTSSHQGSGVPMDLPGVVSQSMKDRSKNTSDGGLLPRAWSDPCITLELLEEKMALRRLNRRGPRHFDKSPKA